MKRFLRSTESIAKRPDLKLDIQHTQLVISSRNYLVEYTPNLTPVQKTALAPDVPLAVYRSQTLFPPVLSTPQRLESLMNCKIDVCYTAQLGLVEDWLKKHTRGVTHVGFDIEIKPVYKKGESNATSTVQLCVPTDSGCYQVLVAHVAHMREFPASLIHLVQSQSIQKVGASVGHDLHKIVQDFGLSSFGGAYEVAEYSKRLYYMWDLERHNSTSLDTVYPSKSPGGLKTLFEHYLQLDFKKSKRITMSNWEACPLSYDQVSYAAMDAWASLILYECLEMDIQQSLKRLKLDPGQFENKYHASCQEANGIINQWRKEQSLKKSSLKPTSQSPTK